MSRKYKDVFASLFTPIFTFLTSFLFFYSVLIFKKLENGVNIV